MDCDALAWYDRQDDALRARIRMLAHFTANLQGLEWRCALPGACKGAREDRAMFEQIVDQLVAPHLRTQGVVSRYPGICAVDKGEVQ